MARNNSALAADLTLGLVSSSQYHSLNYDIRVDNHNYDDNYRHDHSPDYHDLKGMQYYHKALQEERHKIRAFEHELPFCTQLLDHAIEASREQLADRLTCKLEVAPAHESNAHELCHSAEAGLFAGNSKFRENPPSSAADTMISAYNNFNYNPHQSCIGDVGGSNFINFKAESAAEEDDQQPANHHCLQHQENGSHQQHQVINSSHLDHPHYKSHIDIKGNSNPQNSFHEACQQEQMIVKQCTGALTVSSLIKSFSMDQSKKEIQPRNLMPKEQGLGSQGVQRKPRRCWSQELHQLFLNALCQLGGCQVATPKQIRELMNVEGLTNDEVKSHLQKFRLHMRRPSLATQGDSTQEERHLLVFGHVWMPESSISPCLGCNKVGSSTTSLFSQVEKDQRSTNIAGHKRLSSIMKLEMDQSLLLSPRSCVEQGNTNFSKMCEQKGMLSQLPMHADEEQQDEAMQGEQSTWAKHSKQGILIDATRIKCDSPSGTCNDPLLGLSTDSSSTTQFLDGYKKHLKC